VFDAKGRVAKLVERAKGQPFTLISGILPTDDGRILVYDTLDQSLSELGENLDVRSTRPFPYRPALVLPDNRYLHADHIQTRERVGQPIHLLDRNGGLLRSFGADTDEYRADEPLKHERVIAKSADGTIWSAAPGRYVLERWNPSTGGRQSQTIVGSPWFKESVRRSRSHERPVPEIVSLWEAGDFMWVLLRDADVNWRPPESPGERPFDISDLESARDFVLEAVSIQSGQVIATWRSDRAIWGRGPSLLLATRRQGGNNRSTVVEVWQPQLVTREKKL
jgi:hypothetical protein